MNSRLLMLIILCTYKTQCEDTSRAEKEVITIESERAEDISNKDYEISEEHINDGNEQILNSQEEHEKIIERIELDQERQKEKEAGHPSDYFGTNQHYNIAPNFEDFGRRFVLTYPYFERNPQNTVSMAELKLDNDVKEFLEMKKASTKMLTPVKAPPEFVISIAQQSALLEGSKPKNPSEDVITKNIFRTGEYWDGVWKEDVDVENVLRTSINEYDGLEPLTVTIEPGSKLYELISKLQEISPTLLYVIHKSKKN